MAQIVEQALPLPEVERSRRLFAGDVIIFRQVVAAYDLIEAAHGLIADAFAPHDPLTVHDVLTPGDFGERLVEGYETDPVIRSRFAALLEAVGASPATTAWDRLRLRIQPPEGYYTSRRVQSLPAHRDSWGTAIMAQVNWWLPIHPVSAARTMVLYPDYFERPVANSSADWDFDELRARLKAGDQSYPVLPDLLEPVAEASAWPALIAPGDVLCFASAHLHGSAPNETALVRYSTEVRTVSRADLDAGRGAPNADTETLRVSYDWFTGIADGKLLGEAVR